MNRIIHFEIHAADPERAARFYRDLFGWDIQEWLIPGVELPDENRYWSVTIGPGDEPGINGGILFRSGAAPADSQAANAYVCTVGVSSVDEYAAKALAAGGAILHPKMAIRGVGWIVHCRDTEGNRFGMMKEDREAR